MHFIKFRQCCPLSYYRNSLSYNIKIVNKFSDAHAFIQVMAQIRLEALVVVIVTLFAALFECTFVDLALGSRFPGFTEIPRARFVD
jgi:hypothetical protein